MVGFIESDGKVENHPTGFDFSWKPLHQARENNYNSWRGVKPAPF